MSEVLGHDCDGRPLRAGDRIQYVGGQQTNPDAKVGQYGAVVQIEPNEHLRIRYWLSGFAGTPLQFSCDDGCLHCGIDEYLRRVDGVDEGDWSEIERETGWHPHKELEQA